VIVPRDPRFVTLLRDAAKVMPARQINDGREIASASSDNSTPRLRSLPTFSSRSSTTAGCGTLTDSNRSDVFLT